MCIDKNKRLSAGTDLRLRAEERLHTNSSETGSIRGEDETQRLLHELQVHRIELEMQNAELRTVRDEMEKSLEKYTDLFDFAPVGYLTLDRNGTITTANLSAIALLGGVRSQLIGRQFLQWVMGRSRPAFSTFLDTVYASMGKVVCEVALQREGMSPLYVQVEAMDDASGLECRLALVDISERKRTEELLQQSEKRYRTVVEDQTEIICRFTADGAYTFVNDVYCRVVGKTREELLESRWCLEVIPDDVSGVENQLRALLPLNPVVSIENRIYTGSGAIRWMHFLNRGFFDTEGRLIETQAVGRDITERKQAEDDLRSYARRLIEMEEDLRKKLATELHDEIGRDLTAIGMNMAIFSHSLTPDAPKNLVERVTDSSRLVEGISRTVRGIMVELRPPVLDDYGLFTALRWHADLFTKRTGISVLIQADDPLPRLMVEKEMALFRISQEALLNASKHAAVMDVSISISSGSGMLRLRVSDNGKGFTPTSFEHIQGGPGWGMKIMRERAELIGGHFHVDSVLGKGTIVSVDLALEDR